LNWWWEKGCWAMPRHVPFDKWRLKNLKWVMDYYGLISHFLSCHEKWFFIDKTHFVNDREALPRKACKDPLTGYIDAIPVSGDFRDTHNMFAVVSANPAKEKLIEYLMMKEKGTSHKFLAFINKLIATCYILYDEVFVMDNAIIRTGGDVAMVKHLLWNSVVDDRLLHCAVIYLPAWSSELNLIECIFNIRALFQVPQGLLI
jgi:hypothetical protein